MVVKDKEKYTEKIKAAVEYIGPNKTSASLFFFFFCAIASLSFVCS